MPYIITKTNGSTLAVIDDASLDTSTDLSLVGRNYSGYGATVNENFVKLLENFANSTPPEKPIQGELWFNISNKTLNVCYDGRNFRSLANISIQSTAPSSSSRGDLWWDTSTEQLKAFDGSSYQVIGPAVSAVSKAEWISVDERTSTGVPFSYPISKFVIGFQPTVTISKDSDFTPFGDDLDPIDFPIIKRGITLLGADAVTGSTKGSGYYFWGTAAESLKADTAVTSTNVTVAPTAVDATHYIAFANTSTGAVGLKTDSGITYNPFTNVLGTVASQAYYADLAERYYADAIYEPGTVLVIGGVNEVTVTSKEADTAVIGVVSSNPAYLMNGEAGTNETHPPIALKGRVPCKVVAPINKGDLLVTSSTPGYARAWRARDSSNAVIGKALQSLNEGLGVIEVLVT